MDSSYKAVTSHTLWFRLSRPAARAAQAVTASGCHGPELKGRWPHHTAPRRPRLATGATRALLRSLAYAFDDTPEAYGVLNLVRRVQPSATGRREQRTQEATPLALRYAWGAKLVRSHRTLSVGVVRSAPCVRGALRCRLLRRLGRLGRRALRSGLACPLLLRCGVRLRVALFEVRERIARLLRAENPGATLRRCRTRVRLAQVRAYDLTGDSERSSQVLGAERLSRSHCNHLTFGVRFGSTLPRRGVERRTRPIGIARSVRCFGGDRCAVHGYSVARATQRTPVVTAYTRPKARRTYVRTLRTQCVGTRVPRYCLCTPPSAPPRVARHDSFADARERSELSLEFPRKSLSYA